MHPTHLEVSTFFQPLSLLFKNLWVLSGFVIFHLRKKKSINHLLITHSLTRTNQILPFLIRASLHVLAHFASTNILVRNKQDFGNLEDHSRWKVNFFPLSFWLFFSLIQILLWMSSKSLRRDAHKLPSNGEGEY